jgi:PhzF family phenazine biosynthesis protein
MRLPIFQVDAFTKTLFKGNPAAVCILSEWLPNVTLQAIAMENNLSETAFIYNKSPGVYEIRWFTPTAEVDLCGHATLASAYVVFNVVNASLTKVEFLSRSGPLIVTKEEEHRLTLDFPALLPEPLEKNEPWEKIIGVKPREVYAAKDYLVVLDNESAVKNCEVDLFTLASMEKRALIITAKGEEVDFVSRFFAPKVGVFEDPVTGSAHCMLVPYWAKQLGKNQLHAKQLSARGGELFCELKEDRVLMGGYGAMYLQGFIEI